MRRKKRRKLKRKFKVLLIALPITVALVALVIFAFQLHTVKVNLDLKQFTESEVKAYMDAKKIDNTLIFWFKNKIGKSEEMDMFEEYSVKINSPFKVTITAYEKKLAGYIYANNIYYYIDDTGRILKKTTEKIKGIAQISGIQYNKLVLYEKINVKNKDVFNALLDITNSIKEYNFEVKKINISEKSEITLYIKNIQVQLGKNTSLNKKLNALNDIYDNVTKYSGILNMKRFSSDGSYTLKKRQKADSDKEKKKNKS